MDDIVRFVERQPTPALLPILRSQQQAVLLADLLDDPERQQSLTELSERLAIPAASVHREIERAERAGLVVSHRIGRTRLVRANRASPYFAPLRELLVMAFGTPARLGTALAEIDGVEQAFIFGSWAARWSGEPGVRSVQDIDVLVLGHPDRQALYRAVDEVSYELGRPVQVQIRMPGWLSEGTGSFHDTVANQNLVSIDLDTERQASQAERKPPPDRRVA